MDYDLKNKKENNCKYINKCNEIFLVNGGFKVNSVDLPISENEGTRTVIIDKICIDTSYCCKSNIKVDFNINVLKGEGTIISKIIFQVFKICDDDNIRIPVGQSLFYSSNILAKNNDSLNLTVYDTDICSNKKCRYILEAKI